MRNSHGDRLLIGVDQHEFLADLDVVTVPQKARYCGHGDVINHEVLQTCQESPQENNDAAKAELVT